MPFNIKIRKGWDDEHINAVQIAQIAERNGITAITVHGRTRAQFYSGTVELNIIKQVVIQWFLFAMCSGFAFITSSEGFAYLK